MRDLEAAAEFAPLHDPAAIEMIREMMERFPEVGHYACFDTVFHETMPEAATTYAIAGGGAGARGAAVRVSWVELRVDCGADARGGGARRDAVSASGW